MHFKSTHWSSRTVMIHWTGTSMGRKNEVWHGSFPSVVRIVTTPVDHHEKLYEKVSRYRKGWRAAQLNVTMAVSHLGTSLTTEGMRGMLLGAEHLLRVWQSTCWKHRHRQQHETLVWRGSRSSLEVHPYLDKKLKELVKFYSRHAPSPSQINSNQISYFIIIWLFALFVIIALYTYF